MPHPPFADRTLLGTLIQFAYWTTPRAPRSATRPPASKRAPRPGAMQRWLAALDNWSYRQQLEARERYLAQAQDIFDLEARLRELERRPSC